MSGYQGTSTRRNATEALKAFVYAFFRDHITTMKGTVKSYDPSKQLGSFQPQMTRQFGDKTLKAPEVQEIRVRHMRGGGHILHFNLKAGDNVTLFSQARSVDTQETKGGDVDYASGRNTALSDVFALPGGGDDTNVVKNLPKTGMHVGNEDGKKGLQSRDNGDVSIVGGDSGNDKFLARKDEKIDIRGGAQNESVLKVIKDVTTILKDGSSGETQSKYLALLQTIDRIMVS